jgi:excisionase family DNA binding protein
MHVDENIRIETVGPDCRCKDRLLKVPELCSILDLSRASIYRLIDTGELPVVRIAGVIRFRHHSILKWMQDRETAPSSLA